MGIIPFWRRKKVEPLQEKLLEIVRGRLSIGDVSKLVELIRAYQSTKEKSPETILDEARAFGLTSQEFNAIWKTVAIDTKLGTEKLKDIFPIDRPDSVLDEIPGGIGQFGRVSSNPIPVSGVSENEVYLARLRTLDGDPIAWQRQGSCGSDNIKGMIDEYRVWNAWTGEQLGVLYISPYNRYISGKAPDGFVLPGPGRNVLDHASEFFRLMVTETEISRVLKEMFGLALPVSGGNGQRIDDAMVVHVKDRDRAEKIEEQILACIHKLGNKEWQIERTQIMEHKGRRIRKVSVVLRDDPDHYRNFYFDVTDYG